MHAPTGEIYRLTAENRDELRRLLEREQLLALTEDEYQELEPLSKPKRKNVMRNKPCPCGSRKKFKKCCWSNYL